MKNYLALAAAALAFVPGVAMAQDSDAKLNGFRAEARLGYETPTISGGGAVYKIGSAVSYGGEIGYDLKIGKTVQVGPYAAYEFSSVSLCNGGQCLNEQGNLGVGARLGFAVSPKVVLYGKLGYARITAKYNAAAGGGSDNSDGVQGAIGVDYNLSKNAYVMAEIDYADYGKYYAVNLQRRHVAVGVGFRF